jgi:nucleotide-binding universal stress UspA family protein
MTELRSILVPLDGSAFAEQALAFAVALGRAAKAKLRLVLVHQHPDAPTTPEATKLYTKIELATRRAERDYLNRVADRLKQDGYPGVTRVVLAGEPGPRLAEDAAEWGPSLIVMSTHGRGPLARAWLGSVADFVVRHVAVPVLLVRPTEGELSPVAAGNGAGPILVPLDGSRLSEAALAPAADIARLLGAALSLVRVVRPVAAATGISVPIAAGYDERLTALCRQEAQDYLDGFAERLHRDGVRASATAVLGESVAGTILDLARSEPVRLIALATRGRGGVRRLTLGSVADKVVRGADAPVLICPAKGRWG